MAFCRKWSLCIFWTIMMAVELISSESPEDSLLIPFRKTHKEVIDTEEYIPRALPEKTISLSDRLIDAHQATSQEKSYLEGFKNVFNKMLMLSTRTKDNVNKLHLDEDNAEIAATGKSVDLNFEPEIFHFKGVSDHGSSPERLKSLPKISDEEEARVLKSHDTIPEDLDELIFHVFGRPATTDQPKASMTLFFSDSEVDDILYNETVVDFGFLREKDFEASGEWEGYNIVPSRDNLKIPEEEKLCSSKVQMSYPTGFINLSPSFPRSTWEQVIQTDVHRQSFYVETCEGEGERCKNFDYTDIVCKQMKSYRKVWTVDRDRNVFSRKVAMDSGCKCSVT